MRFLIKKALYLARRLVSDLGLLVGFVICRLMPIDWVSNFGAKRGRYASEQQTILDNRVQQNLTFMGYTGKQEKIIAELKAESGRAPLEMLIADRIYEDCRIKWRPSATLDALILQRRSIIFVGLHLSNLGDLLGAAINDRVSSYRMWFVVRPIHSLIQRFIVKVSRNKNFGIEKAIVKSGQSTQFARQLILNLKKPANLALLHVDDARQKQVHCPTWGRSIAKDKGLNQAMRLAKLSGACIVGLKLQRIGNQARFEVSVIDTIDPLNSQVNFYEAYQRLDGKFSQIIMASPQKWLALYHLRLTAEQN